MKTQFLITLRDKDDDHLFPSKAAAERRRRTISRNRDPRDIVEIAPL